MEDNYFICTLGQAEHHPKTNAGSVSEFLQMQAEQHGQRPAVGFVDLVEKSTCVLTFHELNEETREAARGLVSLVPRLKKSLGQGRTVGLLAHSHIAFLKAWLGLIRLGFSVLLLAPQLDRASIEHLCGERDVEYLFHDSDHAENAKEVAGVTLVLLGLNELAQGKKDDPEIETQISSKGKFCSVPYRHHSSGTSSGKPKAISQTNAAAFAALPSIDKSPAAATFSSTPLYHGGVADCFRAWTSGQMIWLFPGGEKPITAQTVLACLSVTAEYSSSRSEAPVKYFSSVPYVLRDLAANDEGMTILRRMDIVGVGGAAFPTTLGEQLVNEGVNLVSRYGSAECGFLLSSYRDFEKDKDWNYLRSDAGARHLSFELQDSGLFELVVKPGWPHMAKTNRADGSYATADLFEQHTTIPNAWRYHSRADAQITLVSGKKFDPEPIESAIVSKCTSDLLSDVLIVGDGEGYPGMLVFVRNRSDLSPRDILEQVWSTVNEVNRQNPSHARLSKAMIRIMTHESEMISPLQKSSKGTILRGKAHERYHDEIRELYGEHSTGSDLEYSVDNKSDLITAITGIVETTTGKSLHQDDDFFEQGIDSIACMQIKNTIQSLVTSMRQRARNDAMKAGANGRSHANCLSTSPWFRNGGELPSNLLYDCGTIKMVISFLLGQSKSETDDDLLLMNKLATKYSNFAMSDTLVDFSAVKKGMGLVVVLTGATGALGTHLLDALRSRSDVQRVYCLLRASDSNVAYERVNKALKSKAKDGLQPNSTVDEKVICIPCNLAQSNIGLDDSMLQQIRSTTDIIIHAAWAVNFTLRLKSFEHHLAGMQNLLNIGSAAAKFKRASPLNENRRKRPVKLVFCSSIASVSFSDNASVAEKISEEPSDASPLGYSRSKWVAESICANAQQAAKEARIPLDVEIIRIGQLCGDHKDGIWNKTEAWPLMLSTFDVVRSLPDLPDETLDWLPLDSAADAILEVAFRDGQQEVPGTEPAVYHILNPHSTPSWTEMLHWLQDREGDRLQIATASQWLQSLEACLTADYADHPSRKLLSLWKETHLPRKAKGAKKAEFAVTRAASASDTMRIVKPISRDLVEKMWVWIKKSIPANSKGEAL